MIQLVTQSLAQAVAEFARTPPFDRYIDPDKILVTAARGKRGPHGKRAECHFTAFRDTKTRSSRDGRWQFPQIEHRGREIRYVIRFVFPRFLLIDPKEQAKDIVHELLHIDESFCGAGSARKHGVRYDRTVESIANKALKAGIALPQLPSVGETVYFEHFRPFPRPFRSDDSKAQRTFSESDLEIGGLHLSEEHREPPPARYVYHCISCGKQYRRQKPLVRPAACGVCTDRYDARFKLELIRGGDHPWREVEDG